MNCPLFWRQTTWVVSTAQLMAILIMWLVESKKLTEYLKNHQSLPGGGSAFQGWNLKAGAIAEVCFRWKQTKCSVFACCGPRCHSYLLWGQDHTGNTLRLHVFPSLARGACLSSSLGTRRSPGCLPIHSSPLPVISWRWSPHSSLSAAAQTIPL